MKFISVMDSVNYRRTSGSQINCLVVKLAWQWGWCNTQCLHWVLVLCVSCHTRSCELSLYLSGRKKPLFWSWPEEIVQNACQKSTGIIFLLNSWQNHLLRYIKSGKLISADFSTDIPRHRLYHTWTEREVCLMAQSKALVHTNTNTQWEAISTRYRLSASHRAPPLSVCVLAALDKAREHSSNLDNGSPSSRAATIQQREVMLKLSYQ